jgi:hypothetical protein
MRGLRIAVGTPPIPPFTKGVTDDPSVWVSAVTTFELRTLKIWASALML